MARARNKKETGRYSVLGRSFPVAGAALSYAQGVACRLWTEPNAVFIKDIDGTSLYKITRDEEGAVYTTTIKEA